MKLTNSTIGIVFIMLISSGFCLERTEKVERKVSTEKNQMKKGKASSTNAAQSTAQSMRTEALSTLKSKGATGLSYNEWKGWVTEDNNSYSIFDFDVSDVFSPQTTLSKRGMIFKLNDGEALKGKMSQFLELVKDKTYLLPFRYCGPVTLYNPFIKRKYYETTCKGINVKFTFAYLDIENSEWILLQQELEKNRTNRLIWINQKLSESRSNGNAYLEAKKGKKAASEGQESVTALISSSNSEKTQLLAQKTTEAANYKSIETQLQTAKRTLAGHLQERNDLKTQNIGLTLYLKENEEAVKSLTQSKTSKSIDAKKYQGEAAKAQEEFQKVLALLKQATEEPSLNTLTLNDYAGAQRIISAIYP
jgi:hypothetical protein